MKAEIVGAYAFGRNGQGKRSEVEICLTPENVTEKAVLMLARGGGVSREVHISHENGHTYVSFKSAPGKW